MLDSDFIAYDEAGQVRAVIEAKRTLGATADWAARFRRNRLSHGGSTGGGHFIVVTPERLFAWDPHVPVDAPANIEIDLSRSFSDRLAAIGATTETIEPLAFELFVAWWLDELTHPSQHREPPELESSGIAAVLAGARLVGSAAA
ncbi:MAG: hypothetical protein IAG13_24580 [Deltaproteobacteria bacterium]|nr:hypothetical protein [Nannocystaceae bacterium]